MANDEAGATKAMDDLKANAAAIARFLAGANPNLPEDAVYGLMLAHGAHHSAQIDLILADDTAGEADEWAAMQSHMDMIADALAAAIRSEEHTSELQSLMRISYAVFCLKKKKITEKTKKEQEQ